MGATVSRLPAGGPPPTTRPSPTARTRAQCKRDASRNAERVEQLNSALDLDDFAATRLRTIAAHSKQLTAIQKHLPSALEPIYEVTLAPKQDERQVIKAIEDEKLTPDSRLRDIRSLRKQMSASKPPRRG